jgi:uncharacterized protein (TIGR01777 family)
MAHKVLITGGSGLIGTRLTELLLQRQYEVVHIGRQPRRGQVQTFVWDVKKQYVDPQAFEKVDFIIHLAGANVNAHRWTDKFKREILESRTLSTRLLYNELSKRNHQVKFVISASAIGYYGFGREHIWMTEEDEPGTDFMSEVTRQWEDEAIRIESLGIHVARIRTGIVLSDRGGALKTMALPVKFGFGAALGPGDQQISWIHIDDMCALYIHVLEKQLTGPFNAVTPTPVSNADMMKEIAAVTHRLLLLPNIPKGALRLLFGEMAEVLVEGSRVSPDKIVKTGFGFKFPTLKGALEDLL